MTETPSLHSVWLLAAPEDERRLAAEVEVLSRRFGTPRFRPHATLAGDLPIDAARLASRVASVAAGHPALAAPVVGIETGAAYFRAFYARLAATDALTALHAAVRIAAGTDPASPFLPHVSLAYGLPPGPARDAAQAAMQAVWSGTPIRFDRLALVRSADTIPIAQWTVRQDWPLCAPT
ncbi:2'-5' RNA ligase family protein [Prosthecodimorpha staleyi]|uniref:2'-5' RNA ligase family protein n=1 Tax=Prosthecodimorpha staleyi TaxID=2840188 RepID=A0A947GJ24_9HYPH|nr:2'-5' RNA ligase family protein [Prosthecodimorpha staleyi]MBT9290764.1 2'-5' RNA ligase family protein [Prosthecodimorpha staleyi]